MATNAQLNLPPVPVHRLADASGRAVQKVDLTHEDAKASIGRAVQKAILRSNSVLKDFGDASQVGRWCKGENPNLAKLWQRAEVRRELMVALAEESGLASVEVTVRVERGA